MFVEDLEIPLYLQSKEAQPLPLLLDKGIKKYPLTTMTRNLLTYLKHREKEVFLPVFILIPVQREHHYLEQTIDLTKRDLSCEMCNVFWTSLEQEEQSAIEL